ncbi:hypothetical protein AMTR_s00064p00201240 [Amborella trichopoda]|uniref:Uncharacterized protein n=1 Tax=Amborella trichopoda TaxID=13333 RepID=U5DC77_AMBTC|nr:hypothetical protein AMTR_s00064p00201240 [Amborella trichopoda]
MMQDPPVVNEIQRQMGRDMVKAIFRVSKNSSMMNLRTILPQVSPKISFSSTMGVDEGKLCRVNIGKAKAYIESEKRELHKLIALYFSHSEIIGHDSRELYIALQRVITITDYMIRAHNDLLKTRESMEITKKQMKEKALEARE